jgi:hypothetical protein
LFDVAKKFGNYFFEDYTSPTTLRGRVVSYTLGAYKVFIESVVVEASKALIRLEIERVSACFNS